MQEKPDAEMATDEEMEAELARMGRGKPSAPPSPSRPARVEHALLHDASNALAKRGRSEYDPDHPSSRMRGRMAGRGSGRR